MSKLQNCDERLTVGGYGIPAVAINRYNYWQWLQLLAMAMATAIGYDNGYGYGKNAVASYC